MMFVNGELNKSKDILTTNPYKSQGIDVKQ
jgi:hypothetical protein